MSSLDGSQVYAIEHLWTLPYGVFTRYVTLKLEWKDNECEPRDHPGQRIITLKLEIRNYFQHKYSPLWKLLKEPY